MPKAKIKGAGLATGYWGRDPATHIAALQTAERVLALNRDKIFAMGLPFRVWTRVLTPSDPRMIECSCFADTTQQSDAPCLSCYGNRYQPGYLRFGHQTIFSSSIDPTLTLNNLELNKIVAPFRLQLVEGALTGTLTTPTFRLAVQNLGQWEAKVDAFIRDQQNNTITSEFSLDQGVTWLPLNTIGQAGRNPGMGEFITFRVTLTRTSADVKSPLFEILRARYPIVPSPRTRNPLPANPGDILLLKTWDMERFAREANGTQTNTEGERYWTLPLSFFDEVIDRDTPEAVLGRDHFVEQVSGPEAGARYIATKHQFSHNFKIFTRQDFNLRRIIGDPNDRKSGENLMRVW